MSPNVISITLELLYTITKTHKSDAVDNLPGTGCISTLPALTVRRMLKERKKRAQISGLDWLSSFKVNWSMQPS